MENLPQKKQEVSSPMFDEIKEQALMGLVEGILPKLQPFIEPAMQKLEEYFGDDDKIFLIKRNKGQAAKVIVLDNTKGHYTISNSTNEDGTKQKQFLVAKDAIINVYDTGEFVQKLLSGQFTNNKQITE